MSYIQYDLFWRKLYELLRICIFCSFRWNNLFMSVKSIWPILSFNSEVSLLIFFNLDDLSTGESRMLKLPTIVVIVIFVSNGICFMKLGALIFFAHTFITVISSWYLFWLILFWSLLFQRQVQLLLLALVFHSLRMYYSLLTVLSLCLSFSVRYFSCR
jgi:hypothetical protein